jgi:ATP-dependent helicase HrpB
VGELHPGGARQVLDVARQLTRMANPGSHAGGGVLSSTPGVSAGVRHDALLRALFAAYPDRLARRRGPNDRRARMVGGRGVKLAPQSGVLEPELFVCVDVEAGGVESVVRLASGVKREWLPAEQLVTSQEVLFDDETEKLLARKQTRFADLVLDDTQGHFADDAHAAEVLAAACVRLWPKPAPPPDSTAGSFLHRVRWLAELMPDAGLPVLDDATLHAMLPEVCRGKRSVEAVRSGPWLDHLRGAFSYQQLQLIDREAPERVEVPTGSMIEVEYQPGRPPVLAVRIQELFGLTDTPRLAGGRVKVLLHLLAPNYRPQQVTDDLASFWANGYPLVRKELRARYPKHSWPDDPLTATAIRGPKKRPAP